MQTEPFALSGAGIPMGPNRVVVRADKMLGLFGSLRTRVNAESRPLLPFSVMDESELEEPQQHGASRSSGVSSIAREGSYVWPPWDVDEQHDAPSADRVAVVGLGIASDVESAGSVSEAVGVREDVATKGVPAEREVSLRSESLDALVQPVEDSRGEIRNVMDVAAPALDVPGSARPFEWEAIGRIEARELERVFPVELAQELPLRAAFPEDEPRLARVKETPRVIARGRHETSSMRVRPVVTVAARPSQTVPVEPGRESRSSVDVRFATPAMSDPLPLESMPVRRAEPERGKRIFIERLHVTVQRQASAPAASAPDPQQRSMGEQPSKAAFEYVNPWLRSMGMVD